MTARAAALLLWVSLLTCGLMLVAVVAVPQQRSAQPGHGYNPIGAQDPTPMLVSGHAPVAVTEPAGASETCTSGFGILETFNTPYSWVRTGTTGNRAARMENSGGHTNFCIHANGTIQQANTNLCLTWDQQPYQVDEHLNCPAGTVPSYQKWTEYSEPGGGKTLILAWCNPSYWDCSHQLAMVHVCCGAVVTINYYVQGDAQELWNL